MSPGYGCVYGCPDCPKQREEIDRLRAVVKRLKGETGQAAKYGADMCRTCQVRVPHECSPIDCENYQAVCFPAEVRALPAKGG